MDDLQSLEEWVAPLLEKLTPKERRKLARTIATALRRRQRERIADQQNPDGSAYEPRKPRSQAGFVRRQPMFMKIRQAKYMRTRAAPNSAEVSFMGRVARIAQVHQKGLRARVQSGGPSYDYPQRELLGYSEEDQRFIRDMVIDHLTL
ncbi:bacteriophage tail completion protein S [Halomonas cupida]|uniref:Bacteriophage tail completion protein S n=1 Tax=Halomonas cupida TaxID=44933 RepID=A0A1M7KH03_9GAMM|nr:phage virion morphogenesis protein [Halomonas cupida]GEN25394.1 bacteriophage tail completion protein S [Halomonas cupida]SHM64636.1 phage virion morphogenesis (putative tail completion) protein [Halomonas cupida]